MNPAIQPKFDLVKQQLPNGQELCIFARPDNGMIVGAVEEGAAVWGEDATTALRRQFIDHDSGVRWVKERCKELCGREDVEFFEKPIEQHIVVPRGPLPKVRM